MKIENILENLIKFNTVADKENSKITSWIGDFLSQLGFKVSLIKSNKNNKINLFATIGKKPSLTFLVHGHCFRWEKLDQRPFRDEN